MSGNGKSDEAAAQPTIQITIKRVGNGPPAVSYTPGDPIQLLGLLQAAMAQISAIHIQRQESPLVAVQPAGVTKSFRKRLQDGMRRQGGKH